MSFSIGLVGLPNVGKSTLFKALTKKQIDIANYPFCTIEPNKGIVEVPDEQLSKLAEFYNSKKVVSTVIEFWDVAGLVKGAHKGEGLGNKFLSQIREVDAICHVVRYFHDENITHVHGKVDPAGDIEAINIELALADLEIVKKHLDKLQSKTKGLKGPELKAMQKVIDVLSQKVQPALEEGKLLSKIGLDDEERALIKYLDLLTVKPMFFVFNVDEEDLRKELNLEMLKMEHETVIPICAKLEADLADMSDAEVQEYLKEEGISHTGLERIILQSYSLLDLITFFTAGPTESHARTIKRGALAPEAAGKIHTDFQRGFIAAEVISAQDLLDAETEVKAREKGLMRLEGKLYEVKDGDVCIIRFSV